MGSWRRWLRSPLERTRAAFSADATQTPYAAAARIIEAVTADDPPLRLQTSAAARDPWARSWSTSTGQPSSG